MSRPRMAGALLAAGSAFLALLIVWIVVELNHQQELNLPTPLPLGSSFEGNAQIPLGEFKSKYQDGMTLLYTDKEAAQTYQKLHEIADWISFGLTSLITLIVGAAGKVTKGDGAQFSSAAEVLHEEAGEDEHDRPKAQRSRGVGQFVPWASSRPRHQLRSPSLTGFRRESSIM